MHGHPDEACEKEGPERREIMDLQVWKQRREESMDEAQQERLSKVFLVAHTQRGAGRREVEGA